MTRRKLIRSDREARELFGELFIMYFWKTRNGGGQRELKLFGIEKEILFDGPWWKKVYLIAKGF